MEHAEQFFRGLWSGLRFVRRQSTLVFFSVLAFCTLGLGIGFFLRVTSDILLLAGLIAALIVIGMLGLLAYRLAQRSGAELILDSDAYLRYRLYGSREHPLPPGQVAELPQTTQPETPAELPDPDRSDDVANEGDEDALQ